MFNIYICGILVFKFCPSLSAIDTYTWRGGLHTSLRERTVKPTMECFASANAPKLQENARNGCYFPFYCNFCIIVTADQEFLSPLLVVFIPLLKETLNKFK
ncbi:hypothetical protein ATANTOWER_029675 [Ataeniobius toweri]|uniref:Secreted protein n=1 Tax=Ataeniobius toweri TaxID=208326 RepID=A0ABU7BA17_9TELE|nr:hypothetical protein [Ataeniobius toweri]